MIVHAASRNIPAFAKLHSEMRTSQRKGDKLLATLMNTLRSFRQEAGRKLEGNWKEIGRKLEGNWKEIGRKLEDVWQRKRHQCQIRLTKTFETDNENYSLLRNGA